mmetsp:Transcript_85971/g.188850  ORF Transcript_85971/g.188850 Transcript_85971/m.188850 type:complete len:235 (-) Transcript_85971:1026-1730(-)
MHQVPDRHYFNGMRELDVGRRKAAAALSSQEKRSLRPTLGISGICWAFNTQPHLPPHLRQPHLRQPPLASSRSKSLHWAKHGQELRDRHHHRRRSRQAGPVSSRGRWVRTRHSANGLWVSFVKQKQKQEQKHQQARKRRRRPPLLFPSSLPFSRGRRPWRLAQVGAVHLVQTRPSPPGSHPEWLRPLAAPLDSPSPSRRAPAKQAPPFVGRCWLHQYPTPALEWRPFWPKRRWW